MADDVAVRFGASIEGLIKGTQEATAALNSFKEQAAKGIDVVTGSFTGLLGTIAKLAAFARGGALFGSMISEANAAAGEVGKLAKMLGESVAEASPLRVELKTLGIETDLYASAAQRLDRQIKTNEDSLRRVGVATRDANGELKSQR